jgi:hypothetical protein
VKSQQRSEARLEGGKEFREGTAIHRSSEENIRRTVQLVTQVAEQMYFKDEDHFRREVAKLLERFYRLIGR